jgi:riboflavin kinase/FMN adenylyltransferase
MHIYRKLSEVPKDINTVLTVGTFDGVHLGHQDIFKRLKQSADANGFRSVVITFDPHPRSVVSRNFELKLLTTFEEKVDVLSKFVIDALVVINFTEEFSRLTSEEFIVDCIIEKVGLSEFIIGHDHKFGKGRDGDETLLRTLSAKYGFKVTVVKPVLTGDLTISSTIVRNALLEGNIHLANNILGRNYSFSGSIVTGATRGRILGFPTANIKVDRADKLIPQTGVYAVECKVINRRVFGVMNIGFRPTFEDDGDLVIEVHLFNFDNDIYDEKIEVKLVERIRDEKKFESKEELIYQIGVDKRKAIQVLGKLIN